MTSLLSIPTAESALLLHFSPGHGRGVLLLLVAELVVVLVTERRSQRIPNLLPIAVVLYAVVHACVRTPPPWEMIAGGGVVGAGIPLVARFLTRGGIGLGDVKLAGAIGLLLGPVSATAALLAATLLALASIALGRVLDGVCASCEFGVTFGPYMVAGAILAVLLESGCAP